MLLISRYDVRSDPVPSQSWNICVFPFSQWAVSINGYTSLGRLLEEYTGYVFVLELQELYSASPSRDERQVRVCLAV